MTIGTFEYHRPRRLREALDLLAELPGAEPLAGGTDILVDLRRGAKEVSHLVSLAAIAELRGITEGPDEVSLGALVTHNQVARSSRLRELLPDLSEAASTIGSEQVRNSGTVGGNICTAASCADMAPPLLVRRARVELVSKSGSRQVPLEDFMVGARQTCRRKDEILARIIVPKPVQARPGAGSPSGHAGAGGSQSPGGDQGAGSSQSPGGGGSQSAASGGWEGRGSSAGSRDSSGPGGPAAPGDSAGTDGSASQGIGVLETGAFVKFGLREGSAIAVASAAAALRLGAGVIEEARVALGAVSPAPMLAPKASEVLGGGKPSRALFEEAGKRAAEEAEPIDDVRGSAAYRRRLVAVLTRRALEMACRRAGLEVA